MMDRRRFFFAASALVAGALIENTLATALVRTIPTLHGDGIHDDAPALQALVDGGVFHDPRGLVKWNANEFLLAKQRLRIDSTVVIPSNGQRGIIMDCYFCCSHIPDSSAFQLAR